MIQRTLPSGLFVAGIISRHVHFHEIHAGRGGKGFPPRKRRGDWRRHQRIAFTLIELLVVVAIISLLVSILLPSLTKAKDLAKQVVCESNLRQIGSGFIFYAEDSGGFLPAPVRVYGSDRITWEYLLGNLYLGAAVHYPPSDSDRKSIFACPSDQIPRVSPISGHEDWGIPRSYGMLGWKPDHWPWAYWDQFFDLHDFSLPSQQFLATEWHNCFNVRGPDWPGVFISQSLWRDGFDPIIPAGHPVGETAPYNAGGYHGEGIINYLFVDTHVESLNMDQAEQDVHWTP
jgi:prepilin-type N-terminal cleavage/methylation domain-containing protein/prepilin-type processing-associated H-X9-DG protein